MRAAFGLRVTPSALRSYAISQKRLSISPDFFYVKFVWDVRQAAPGCKRRLTQFYQRITQMTANSNKFFNMKFPIRANSCYSLTLFILETLLWEYPVSLCVLRVSARDSYRKLSLLLPQQFYIYPQQTANGHDSTSESRHYLWMGVPVRGQHSECSLTF